MEIKQLPKVTAVTLVYNTGKYVIEAIESIRANNYPNLQHIIVDDFSTDGVSVKLIEDYINAENYNCLFIKHSENKGICKTLNEILSLSEGKYLFGLSDDLIFDDKIIKDVALFENIGSNYAVVHSMLQYINYDGSVKYPYVSPHLEYPRLISDNLSFNDVLKHSGFIGAPTAMMRKAAIEDVGGWNENYPAEDSQMWLKLAEKGYKFKFRADLTTYYRRSPTQITEIPFVLRTGSLNFAVKLFGNYLQYPAAKGHLLNIFFQAALNRSPELDEALSVYKKLNYKSVFVYWFFKIRVWVFPMILIKKLKSSTKNLLKKIIWGVSI